MSKSILVIDTPRSCEECELCRDGYLCLRLGEVDESVENGTKDLRCPLKSLPQKIDANDWHRMFSGTYKEREAKGYGYNACLNEILGDTE